MSFQRSESRYTVNVSFCLAFVYCVLCIRVSCKCILCCLLTYSFSATGISLLLIVILSATTDYITARSNLRELKREKEEVEDDNSSPFDFGVCKIGDKCGTTFFGMLDEYSVRATDGNTCEDTCTVFVNFYKNSRGYNECGKCACSGRNETWQCGQPHTYCGYGDLDEYGIAQAMCECTQNVEGKKFCMKHSTCNQELLSCEESADCPGSQQCVKDHCCGGGSSACFDACPNPDQDAYYESASLIDGTVNKLATSAGFV